MQRQSTLSPAYNNLYKDMKHFVHYICSCACFYPEKDVTPNQSIQRQSSETMIHFARENHTKKHSYNATMSEKTPSGEVQHHKSPIETEECNNPMHSSITLPPAPVVPNTVEIDSSPSSSSDDEDTIKINVSDVEDCIVNGNNTNTDPWHVL